MSTPFPDHLQAIEVKLLEHRFRPNEIPVYNRAGVYALFLDEPAALPFIGVPAFGLLYLGMTASSLDVRNHFKHQQSGFSTLRRSLGALLKQELRLQALPRAPGASATNVTSYRFQEDGEQRLTQWMAQHLTYSCVPRDKDVEVVERALIRGLEPPLNLTGWSNPARKTLMALRAACRDEAKRSRAVAGR